MKIRRYIEALTIACAIVTGCSKSEPESNELEGSAYLCLNLVPNKSDSHVRAATATPGTTAESSVTTATAYLFDQSQKLIKIVKYPSDATFITSTTQTKAIIVPKATKYAFIVTGDTQPTASIGNTFATINKEMSVEVANVTVANKFTMTNAGVMNSDIALEALVDVTDNLKISDDLAEASPAEIKLNRVVAKVQLKQKEGWTVKPEGAEAEILGWQLDRTAQDFYPYSKLIDYTGASTLGTYRVCPTFSSTFTDYNVAGNFNVIDPLSGTTYFNEIGDSEYCLENTMDADKQDKMRTTAVLIKAFYKPTEVYFYQSDCSTYTDYNSYFIYDGTVYSLTQIKSLEYPGTSAAFKEFKVLFNEFQGMGYIPATSSIETCTEEEWNDINPQVGMTTSSRMAFYQQGINYYRVLVRHDDAITGTNHLGKYGVVRNNWYTLTINSINGPASQWTPTPVDGEKDDADLSLSVTILVNDWEQWTQNIEF